MKNTVKISKADFIKMLLTWNLGAQPASIQYVTEPKLTAEGKKRFGNITKIANVGGMIGYSYENSVNNQLERENKEREFMAQPLWKGKGKRLSPALATHIENGNFYLTYKAQQTFKSFHFDINLNFVPYAILKSFFPESKNYSQGVNEGSEVHHREIKIDNVRRVKIKKVTYELI
jgi:hypothetical protein